MMNNILVLCTGNICRSPMAAALLQQALPSTQINSAGLAACIGVPADPWAVALMQELTLDISGHRGRQVSMPMLRAADLVLVMDVPQQRQLESHYPAGRGKISRFCHFGGRDVPDPYREGEQAFRLALQLIESGVADWTERLTRLSRKQTVKEVA